MQPATIYTAAVLRDAAGGIQKDQVSLWRGAPWNWRLALFDSADVLNDLSGIVSAHVTMTNAVNGGPGKVGWVEKEIPVADMFPGSVLQDWMEHAGWHLEVPFSGDDMLIPVYGLRSPYWVIVEMETTGGELIPIAAMVIDLRSTRGDAFDREPLVVEDGISYNGTSLTFGGIPLLFS